MKKLILTPKNDTVTICLPDEWVGKPIVCILKDPCEIEDGEIVAQVSEAAMCYNTGRFRNPSTARKTRYKRLRRRGF